MRCCLWFLALLFLAPGQNSGEDAPVTFCASVSRVGLARPDGKPRAWAPIGRLEHPALQECSGIVASRKHPGAFWVHNDSGHPAQLFAVDATGRHLAGPIEVVGAVNVDWEDIAMDSAGRLILADVGNNFSIRSDLRVYVLPEPALEAQTVTVESSFRLAYSDQIQFPSPVREYDCESVFAAGESLFFFTKDRRSGFTRLYEAEGPGFGRDCFLVPVAEADIHGPATAADISPDGRRVALLSLRGLWLFEFSGEPRQLFGGAVRYLPIRMGQAEAVAFDGPDAVLIVNEGRNLYRVPVAEMTVVQP